MLQYKIPQNIGIEDRIVGPFTLKQLIIVAVGGGISYLTFLISSKIYELNSIEYVLIALPFILSLAFALVKINNVTLFKFLLLTLEFSIKPKKRLWDHRSILNIIDPNLTETKTNRKGKENSKESVKERKNINLDDLSKILDSGGFEHVQKVEHQDLDVAKDNNLIAEAFFGHLRKNSKTSNMYWRTIDSKKELFEMMSKIPAVKKEEETPKPSKPSTKLTASPEQKIEVEKKEMAKLQPSVPALKESDTKKELSAGKKVTFTIEKKPDPEAIQEQPKEPLDTSETTPSEAIETRNLPQKEVKNETGEKEKKMEPPKTTVKENLKIENKQREGDEGEGVESEKKQKELRREKDKIAPDKFSPSKKMTQTNPKDSRKFQGEIDLEELRQGETIEFNLD